MPFEADSVRLPQLALETLLNENPKGAEALADLLWRCEFVVAGALPPSPPVTSLLAVIQLAAVCEVEAPVLLADLVEAAAPPTSETTDLLHVIATQALGRPATMRWITANADRVAASPNWTTIAPGLGGLTISVPLAEEALVALMKKKAKLPRETAEYIQLNPWFSRRFAIRFRRRMRGKRIRFPERSATARAWSHARTLLLLELPTPWQSLLKRGVGRPLDKWSMQSLTRYVETFHKLYEEDGVPPVLASLYAVAAAGIDATPAPQQVCTRWTALPYPALEAAHSLVGIAPPSIIYGPDDAAITGLRTAIEALGDDESAWRQFAELASHSGFAAAAQMIQSDRGAPAEGRR